MRKLKTLEMHRLTVDQFKAARKLPLIVVLDDVRSLYNVGSVFRCSDAFRVEAVWLCGITATPPNAEIHKTALGGEDSVDWRYFERTEDAIEELRRQDTYIYSVEQAVGSTALQDLPVKIAEAPHYAVIFGNGERRKAEYCRCFRRLSGDSPVRYKTFAQYQRHRRHRRMGVLQTENRRKNIRNGCPAPIVRIRNLSDLYK